MLAEGRRSGRGTALAVRFRVSWGRGGRAASVRRLAGWRMAVAVGPEAVALQGLGQDMRGQLRVAGFEGREGLLHVRQQRLDFLAVDRHGASLRGKWDETQCIWGLPR